MVTRLIFEFLVGIIAYVILHIFLSEWLSLIVVIILGLIILFNDEPA